MAIHNDPLAKIYTESVYDIPDHQEYEVLSAVIDILKENHVDPTQFTTIEQLWKAYWQWANREIIHRPENQTRRTDPSDIAMTEMLMCRTLDAKFIHLGFSTHTNAIDGFVYDLKPISPDRPETGKRLTNRNKYKEAFKQWKDTHLAIQKANQDSGINTDF